MPKYFVPRKSGVHRAACCSLFRSLLRRVNQLPSEDQQRRAVYSRIKTVFKRNATLQSPQQITEALHLGYESLAALKGPTTWRAVFTRLFNLGDNLLRNARASSHGATRESNSEKVTFLNTRLGRPRIWPLPNAGRTLDRPYPTVSGRRHVPKLVNANRVPILRLRKPQSPYLSRIIRDTVKAREKRIIGHTMLTNQLSMAEGEDVWDDIILEEFGLEGDQTETSWTAEIEDSLQQNHQSQVRAIKKRAEIATRMHAIVEQEKALAAEEQQSIWRAKRRRIEIRRLARKGISTGTTEQDQTLSAIKQDSDEAIHGLTIREEEKSKTKGEIDTIKAKNGVLRTNAEVAKIKAARVKRKEEKSRLKEEKVKRRAENVEFWRKKLDGRNAESVNDGFNFRQHEATEPMIGSVVHLGAK